MHEELLLGLAGILFMGVAAQYLSWRLKFPAILFLLVFGFLAGPVFGWLDPSLIFGDLLLPIVSVSVAIILFEGGLSLRFREIRETGKAVRNLLSIGVFFTWLIASSAAAWLFHFNIELSILMGAILIVSGPTVIGPLLKHVHPTEKLGNILKWEGIVIDPIGALLAVLAYEAIFVEGVDKPWFIIIVGILKTVILGTSIGLASTGLLIGAMRYYWIPDHLHGVLTMTLVVATYTASNLIQPESGLFVVTVMGIMLANQRMVPIKHIEELKENLRILLISILFIVMGARFKLSSLDYFNFSTVFFLGVLIFVGRPLAVFLSTIRTNLNWRERLFLSWMAPRGIVSAAMASIFALRLTQFGYGQLEYWEALIFIVIVVTVLFYGLTAAHVARWLGVVKQDPQGALLVGAHDWSIAIAKGLQTEGFKVVMVDTNPANARRAAREGLPAHHGNILSENISSGIDMDGIGHLLALTSNDEANSLIALKFAGEFGRARVHQLAPAGNPVETEFFPKHLRGRFLFGSGLNFSFLNRRYLAGARIRRFVLTPEFDYKAFQARYGQKAVVLFYINERKELQVVSADAPPVLRPGCVLLCLVDAEKDAGSWSI